MIFFWREIKIISHFWRSLKRLRTPAWCFWWPMIYTRFGAPGSIIEQESCFTRYTGNNSWQLHYQMHPDSSLQPPGHRCLWLSFVRWVASQLNQNNNKKRRPIIIFTENSKNNGFPKYWSRFRSFANCQSRNNHWAR